jgi:dTMP kinase
MPGTSERRGIFITFEGIEASGKSTQAIALANSLGGRCLLSREPGGTPFGQAVRSLLLDASTAPVPQAESLLFLADRAQHLHEVVRPGLAAGKVVVSDRYQDSSLAYQAVGRGLGPMVSEVFRHIGGVVPDLTVLIDLDVDVALGRIRSRGNANRLDSEAPAFHARVRTAFLDLARAEPARFVTLDGNTDPDDLAAKILSFVRERFEDLR